MKRETIIKTGALGLLTVALCVLGAVWPITAFLCGLFGGGALLAICVKHGFLGGVGVCVASCAIALLFSGRIGPAAVSAASISFVALILAYCIRKEMSFKRTMAVSIVVAAAVNAAIALVGAYLNYGTVSTAALLKPILDMIDALYGPALAGQAEAEAMLGEIKNMLTGSYVGYSVVASILSAYFTFLWGRLVLVRIYGFDMSRYDYFDRFRISLAGGVAFAASFVLMLLAGDALLKLAFSNFVIIMSPVFLLGGLSVAKFYLAKVGVGPRGRMFFYAAVFLTAFMPYFSLANGMVAVGVIDSLVNYRKF